MDSDTSPSSGLIGLLAWVEVNKKKLLIGGAVLLLATAVTAVVVQQQAQREQNASSALSELRVPFNPGAPVPPGTAEALLNLANEYKGTKAATRALLMSAGVLFGENKFGEAQDRFNKLIQDYPDCPWLAEANLGIASSLEAQGKTQEATAKYEDIRRRFANSSIIDETKLSLARLYAAQKPEEAFKLTEELLKAHPQEGLGMEAGMLQEDMLKKHPELAKLREPIVPPTMPNLSMTNQPIRIPPPTNRPTAVNTNLRTITLTNRPGTGQPMPIKLSLPPATGTSAPVPVPGAAPTK